MLTIFKAVTLVQLRKIILLGIFPLFVLLSLQACDTPVITGPVVSDLAFGDLTPRPADFCQPHHGVNCAPDLQEFPSFAELGKVIRVLPLGTGTCGIISVDFGDGTPIMTFQNLPMGDAANPGLGVQHSYTGWPGRKLVRVKGLTDCFGEESKQIMVARGPEGRGEFQLAFAPTRLVCEPVPNVPPLRNGSVVKIFGDAVIQYGPFIEFNADGEPGTVALTDFAFPGLRKFSVVYRIGSQVVQGGQGDTLFTVSATAPLEICLNDNPLHLSDNTGVGHFVITVNEVPAG